MINRKQIIAVIIIVLVMAGLPILLDTENNYIIYYLFMTFTYLALAQSWNLIAGYTGQISLGHHAFFGLGGYVMAMGWLRGIFGYLDPLGFFLSGLVPALLAIAIGMPLLSKLRGDYFALGTLGLGEILRTIFIQGRALTGGSGGLMLNAASYTSMTPYYLLAFFIAFLATAVNVYLIKTSAGLALIAIRDDETAAAANGINVLKYKLLAFSLGAFITGFCGSLQAYYIFHIHPQNFFGLNWTLYPILMCVIGGSGTFTGPVMGAVFMTALFEAAKIWLPDIHPLFSGGLIILTILFLPNGIVSNRWFGKILEMGKDSKNA